MKIKSLLYAHVAAVAVLAGGQAFAADAVGTSVSEVVVTATKRETALQKTPIAVTSVSATALENNHVMNMVDLTHLVPSFQATSQGDHGVVTMTMRGIGNDSAKTEYADPEVALFVDGVYAPRPEGASALLLDMQAIEVLRGPQGTLWGRNSTVGTVNMVTAKPTLGEVGGNVQAGVGTFGRVGVRGAINVPLSDTFAVRLAFAHEQHDGYADYQNPNGQIPTLAGQMAAYLAGGGTAASFRPINPNLFVQNGDKYSAQNQSAVRLSALFVPNDTFSWNVSGEYFQDRGTPGANLMQVPRAGQKFWSALIDTAPYLNRDAFNLRSRMEFDLSDYLSLTYVAGAAWFNGKSDYDQDGGAHAPTSFATGATFQQDRTNDSDYFSHSHELTLKSNGENTLDWILGVYYGAEDNSIRFDIPIFNGTQEGTVGWQGSFIQPKETVRTEAVFGQAVWNVSDRFHITGGLRYTDDKRTNQGGTNNAWSYNAACPQTPLDIGTNPLDPAVNPSCFNTYQHNDGVFTGNKLTYLARVDGEFTEGLFGYASFSTGYKSGGLQDGGVPYGPETLYNYEVGVKATLFGGRATFNNAVFYQDIKGYQFSAPVTFACSTPPCPRGLATSNAEGAKVYGLESEFVAHLTPDDLLQVTAAFLHTELGYLEAGSNDYGNLVANFGPGGAIRNGPACSIPGTACATFTGNELAHAPDLAIHVGYTHDAHLSNGAVLQPRINFHYETASWLSLFNDGPGDRQKSYTRTDLALRYTSASSNPWWVEAFVQNAEDAKIRTNAGATGDNIYTSQYLAPRTFGVDAGIRF